MASSIAPFAVRLAPLSLRLAAGPSVGRAAASTSVIVSDCRREMGGHSHFSTTASVDAAAKAKKAPMKKKTALKKNSASGPRSSGPKKKASGGAALATGSSFARDPVDLSGLQVMHPENSTEGNLGQPLALGDRVLTALKECGTPGGVGKAIAAQPRPWLVLRPQTLSLFAHLDSCAATQSTSSSSSLPQRSTILTGPSGSGVSALLLQSVSYALDSGWIVLYLPHVRSFVDGSSAYAYSEAQQAYLQPALARRVLSSVLALNGSQLSKLNVNEGVSHPALSISGLKGAHTPPLDALARAGLDASSETGLATHQALDLVLRTLLNQEDVPVLAAVDGFQALCQPTRYRSADYAELQPFEMDLARLVRETVSNSQSPDHEASVPPLAIRRGAIIAGLSHTDNHFPVRPELTLALHQRWRSTHSTHTTPSFLPPLSELDANPYARTHSLLSTMVRGMPKGVPPPLELSPSLSDGFGRDEADRVWREERRQRGVASAGSDEAFLAAMLASSGNPRALVRGAAMSALHAP